MTLKQEFVKTLVSTNTKYPQLNHVILAQAIHETADFTSVLAREHMNFFGMKWREEMGSHAAPITIQVPSETKPVTFCHFNTLPNAVNGYFKFLSRSPYAGWEKQTATGESFISFIGPIWCPPSADPQYVSKVLKHLPYARQSFGQDPSATRKKVVALDSGHSLSKPGARSNDGSVREEVVVEAATVHMKGCLEDFGFSTRYFNPNPDDLAAVGKFGWGDVDVMVSVHLNSYKNKNGTPGTGNPYAAVMVDPQAPESTKLLAQKCARAMVTALKGTPHETKIFSGNAGMEGVYEAELTVLNTSAKDPDSKPPIHMLLECFFLNKFSDEAAAIVSAKKACEAVAHVLKEELL